MKKIIVGFTAGMLIGSAATAFASEDVGNEVKALLASFNFKVNGVEKKLETTPLVYEGTAYLPVREVAKLTGYELDYKEETRTIELKSNTPSSTPSAGAAQEKPKAAEEQAKSNRMENKREPMAGEGNWVDASDLKNAFLSNKISFGFIPAFHDEEFFVTFSRESRLGEFKLDHSSYFILLDITPLIRAGIVKLEARKITVGDLNKAAKIEDKPEAKVGNGNWVDFYDLMETLNRKKYHSFGGGEAVQPPSPLTEPTISCSNRKKATIPF